jgi:hypothetical protein
VAGLDEYGASNVFWYCSGSQPGSVYVGTQLDRVAVASESLIRDAMKWQLGGSTSGDS